MGFKNRYLVKPIIHVITYYIRHKTFNGHTNWLYGHNKSTRQPTTAVPEAASQEPGLTAVTTLPVQGHPVPFFQTK